MTRDEAIALMVRLEGGEANVAGDPGGHTKYGITQDTLTAIHQTTNWGGWEPMLPANVADLTESDAATIYRAVDWDKIQGDALPPTLAPLVLNQAVNMGEPRAVMLLQATVGVAVDGVMGPATLYAIRIWRSRYMPEQTIAEEYAAHVAARYAQLDANERQFELGWFRRLFRVYTLTALS